MDDSFTNSHACLHFDCVAFINCLDCFFIVFNCFNRPKWSKCATCARMARLWWTRRCRAHIVLGVANVLILVLSLTNSNIEKMIKEDTPALELLFILRKDLSIGKRERERKVKDSTFLNYHSQQQILESHPVPGLGR